MRADDGAKENEMLVMFKTEAGSDFSVNPEDVVSVSDAGAIRHRFIDETNRELGMEADPGYEKSMLTMRAKDDFKIVLGSVSNVTKGLNDAMAGDVISGGS